jgi:Holliday junction resolvasome RuvABC endonuclease subunit
MTLLALDLGKTTGYALIGVGGIVSGFVNFAPQKTRQFEGGGMRFFRFENWLNEMHHQAKLTEIVYEEVRRHIGTAAAHSYGGFLATLTAWCEKNKIPYSTETVQDIKKFVTGKGSGAGTDKNAVIAAVNKRWKLKITDENEADATALLMLRMQNVIA